MFQYAAARSLAVAKGQPLFLDVSDFSRYRLHNGFELSRIFNGRFDMADTRHLKHVLGWRSYQPVRRALKRTQMALLRNKQFVVEPHFLYWPGFFDVPDDCYLVGYWQSEKYFLDVASIIRADFTFKHPLDNHNAEVAKQISQVSAVSLHVRRGDYANNPNTNNIHGLCSQDYYLMAVKYVAERVENPHFFIFSDDIAWTRTALKLDFPCEYIDHNQGIESYNDMRLMSLCRHHIVANSSFSWWGAWLNPDADKIVIAPKRWFANQINVQDLFPPGWIIL